MPQQNRTSTTSTEATRQPILKTLAEALWFPLMFLMGFLLCYLLAFHHPTPHDVKVAVARPAAAAQVEAALGKASPGAFDIRPAATERQARQAVLDREVSAAYSADPAHPVLYVAKADGSILESTVTQAFTAVSAKSGHTLTVREIVPTKSGDLMGTGLFYLALAWTIPSYIMIMMLLRTTLTRRAKILTAIGWGVFAGLAGFVGALAMHVVSADARVVLVGFLLTQAVTLTCLGLAPFAKQFFPGVAVTIFVLLSMPSSGGAIPVQMVPGFFRALHPYMPMGNAVEAMRGILYFDGIGTVRPILALCVWVLIGVTLLGSHTLWQRRRSAAEASEASEASGGEPATDAVPEPPVEDPSLGMPRPTALPTRPHHFGEPVPDLVGTVRTTDGSPLPRALLTVIDGRGRQMVRTTTDHEGRYALAGIPEQYVEVIVAASGAAPSVRRVRVREGGAVRQDFTLTPMDPADLAGAGSRS